MRQKTVLLLLWWLLSILSVGYFVISSAVASDIQKLSTWDKVLISFDHSTETTVILTSILSICYIVFSGFALLGRCCAHNTEVGSCYSSVCTSSFWLGIVYIQSGITVKGFVGKAVMWETQHVWDGTDTAIVRFLFIFSYILGIAYIAFSIVLMCYKSAFAPEYQEYTSSPMLDDTYAQEQDSRYPNV